MDIRIRLRALSHQAGKSHRKFTKASGTPRQIALGVAAGFFFGVLPIPGQYPAALVVCTLLRANRVVAFFPVWLSNPATVVPLYSFNYWIGWLLVGGPGVDRVKQVIETLLPEGDVLSTSFTSNPYAWLTEWLACIGENLSDNIDVMTTLGWEVLLPLYLGCCAVGLGLALVSYYITTFTVQKFAVRVADKRRRRHEKVTAILDRRECPDA